jgi:hypothetical protein
MGVARMAMVVAKIRMCMMVQLYFKGTVTSDWKILEKSAIT